MLPRKMLRALGFSFALAAAAAPTEVQKAAPLRFEGIVSAVVTPFTTNGTVALDIVPVQSEYLKATGVGAVFIGGTTGQSLALTADERMQLAEAWMREDGLVKIVHVGSESIVDAKKLAAHAKKIGAAAIGCMPSVFFKPANTAILVKWLQAVGEAAPGLPLYYYHIPSMTGVNFQMLDLLKEVDKSSVPTFAGVKYTGLYEPWAFPDLQLSMAYADGKYELFFGREEMTAQGLSLGIKGFIGSQFNFAADLYRRIKAAYPDGNYLEIQAAGLELLQLEKALPAGVDGNRLAVEFAGIDIGPDRLPNIAPDAETKKEFFRSLGEWCERTTHMLNATLAMCKGKGAAQVVVL